MVLMLWQKAFIETLYSFKMAREWIDNKKKIEELKIEHSVKMHTFSAQRKLENIEKNLNEKNIDIAFPCKPANKVE